MEFRAYLANPHRWAGTPFDRGDFGFLKKRLPATHTMARFPFNPKSVYLAEAQPLDGPPARDPIRVIWRPYWFYLLGPIAVVAEAYVFHRQEASQSDCAAYAAHFARQTVRRPMAISPIWLVTGATCAVYTRY